MKLTKLIAVAAVSLIAFESKGQLTFGNEQFLFNPVMVTPSLAGYHNNQIKLGYDTRWLGIDGAPATGYINFDKLFNDNTGYNVSIISDRIGPISSVSLANSFSFSVKTTENTKLAFGLRHHLTQSYLNVNANNILDPNDPLLASNQTGVPVNNFDASLAWLNPGTFMVGFSYRNIIAQPRFRFTQTYLEPVLSLHGWYTREFGEIALEAFANFNATANTPINSSIGAMCILQQKFGAGLNYSHKNQVGIFAYVKINAQLNAFYNYNLPISDIAKASKQSHGIGISYRIGKNTPKGNTFFIQPTDGSYRTRMF